VFVSLLFVHGDAENLLSLVRSHLVPWAILCSGRNKLSNFAIMAVYFPAIMYGVRLLI
jgi:hypothetical protein